MNKMLIIFLRNVQLFLSTFICRGSAIVDRMQGLGSEHQAQFHGQTGIGPL
jgi:hypothetical protein